MRLKSKQTKQNSFDEAGETAPEKTGLSGWLTPHERQMAAHVAPFIIWLLMMQLLGDAAGWKYALRTVTGVVLLLWLKPWQGYAGLHKKHILPALLTGLAVYAVWVLPEQPWASNPVWQSGYLKFGLMPFGKLPEPLSDQPYAPETAGWITALIRLAGSAFVIAIIEEFFWRGFILRWADARDFFSMDPQQVRPLIFVVVCLIFGLEHVRWLAGAIAGVAYGLLYCQTRNIWPAVLAHVTTNLVLGLHVLMTGQYQFWG